MMKKKTRVLKKAACIVLFVLSIVVGASLMVGFMILVEKVLAPKDYLFYENQGIAMFLLPWLLMIPAITVCFDFIGRLQKKKVEELEEQSDLLFLWNHLKKGRIVLIVLWLLGLYYCATNITFVTEEQIICHSPLKPLGTAYDYSDVERITTGFGQKSFSLFEYQKKGSFYYKITLGGKVLVFHTPGVNEDIPRYEDSYLELEEFDQRLVSLGISKQSEEKGWEHCDFDSRYVERFRRIIAHKSNTPQ